MLVIYFLAVCFLAVVSSSAWDVFCQHKDADRSKKITFLVGWFVMCVVNALVYKAAIDYAKREAVEEYKAELVRNESSLSSIPEQKQDSERSLAGRIVFVNPTVDGF